MKKFFILFLIPVFLFATTIGVTMTALYCKGKLTEKGFVVKACCKDVNKGGCCDTKTELVKVKDTFAKADLEINFSKSLMVYEISLNNLTSFFINYSSKIYRDKAPPLQDKPLYILFHKLII